ncbi:MAG: DUF4868 domain-containing protein, partial [Clostridia bacterium]
DSLKSNSYSWSLYFFKIDRRSANPFNVSKVRFKSSTYLSDYAQSLISTVRKFQVDSISCVQEYDGENTKVSCDKIELNNEILSSSWQQLCVATAEAGEANLKGTVMGYILCGQSADADIKQITMVKVASPIIKVTNKRHVTFSATTDDELDIISDDLFRLYLTIDFFVVGNWFYAFNHSFEKVFNIESTLKKVKSSAVDEIVATNAFSDCANYKKFAHEYKSACTFITLKKERLEKIKTVSGRLEIAETLNISFNEHNEFIVQDEKQASLLIRYLCYKIIKDDESKDLLEVGTISKVNI